MILVLDNHDSFTFNLVLYLRELGVQVTVARSDEISATEAIASGANAFLISPGPGRPVDAGASIELVQACVAGRKPLLGVCLGHQAIAASFGASVGKADQVMHGKTSQISHDGTGVFAGLPSPFTGTRYHSLVVAEERLSDDLLVNARGDDGTVQGIRHRELPIHGVQFHPESIASDYGHDLLRNFLAIAGIAQA